MSYDCLSADGIMTPGAFGCSLPFVGAAYCNLPTFLLWKGVPMPCLTSEPQSPQITKICKKNVVLRIEETLDTFPTEARRPFPRAKDNAGTNTSVFLYFTHFPLLGNETGNHQAAVREGAEKF